MGILCSNYFFLSLFHNEIGQKKKKVIFSRSAKKVWGRGVKSWQVEVQQTIFFFLWTTHVPDIKLPVKHTCTSLQCI